VIACCTCVQRSRLSALSANREALSARRSLGELSAVEVKEEQKGDVIQGPDSVASAALELGPCDMVLPAPSLCMPFKGYSPSVPRGVGRSQPHRPINTIPASRPQGLAVLSPSCASPLNKPCDDGANLMCPQGAILRQHRDRTCRTGDNIPQRQLSPFAEHQQRARDQVRRDQVRDQVGPAQTFDTGKLCLCVESTDKTQGLNALEPGASHATLSSSPVARSGLGRQKARSDDLLCWQRRFGPLRPATAPPTGWFVEGVGCWTGTAHAALDHVDLLPVEVPQSARGCQRTDTSSRESGAQVACSHVSPFAVGDVAYQRLDGETLRHVQGACMQHLPLPAPSPALQLRVLRERAEVGVCRATLEAKHSKQQARMAQRPQTHHAPVGPGHLVLARSGGRPATCLVSHECSARLCALNPHDDAVDAMLPLRPLGEQICRPAGSQIKGSRCQWPRQNLGGAGARSCSPTERSRKGKHAGRGRRNVHKMCMAPLPPAKGQQLLADIVLCDRVHLPYCGADTRHNSRSIAACMPAILWTSK
jgi:hypothetical protein